ncbi:MAG: sigma-54-dependent Fis family transcriptional regulator [Thermodesulfobacteriota bacterium]|nr:sigma-54-dependent Fis family transcriptional regulator [Thermodesulfobacteriota bacterium]
MKKDPKILLFNLNPERGLCSTLQGILETSLDSNIRLIRSATVDFKGAIRKNKVFSIISSFLPDLIFFLISYQHVKRLSNLIQSIKSDPSQLPIIIVIDGGKEDDMVELLRLGATDFITPPLKAVEILPRIWRALEHANRSKTLTYTLKKKIGLRQLVGKCPAFLAEIEKIPLVARYDASILISGETGTGKELCARAIHYLSPRYEKPFIPVNCGAIPLELIESELFGHVRGAFTGASVSRLGLIQEAQNGTLLLDDVDCLPLQAQVKLLRFLQEKEYRQIGSSKIHKADVRIISATNADLEADVKRGRFRQDLFYRLNVLPIILPPLRERKSDIPILARHFLSLYSFEFDKEVTDLTAEATQTLMLHEWPGNVRELENIIQRAVAMSQTNSIQSSDIILPGLEPIEDYESFQEAKARAIAEFEKGYIKRVLIAHHGNITRAAKAAQKNRRAFWELLRKHHIDVQSFKPNSL